MEPETGAPVDHGNDRTDNQCSEFHPLVLTACRDQNPEPSHGSDSDAVDPRLSMTGKVAFISGASRGIGAESAVALARVGYRVAISARTRHDGESHDHMGHSSPLPGSLQATAAAVEAMGGEALCLAADILDEAAMIDCARATLEHFGRIDLLFNNAVYQGVGNQVRLMEVTREQLQAIYQGNVSTPLALVREFVPAMEAAGGGLIINMLSFAAYNAPFAPADRGGWGFAYSSSKAALGRMAGALQVEHPLLRVYNMEPGTVVTEVMKSSGFDAEISARFKTCTPAAIAAVVAWLAQHGARPQWLADQILHAPAIAKELDLLQAPSLLGAAT